MTITRRGFVHAVAAAVLAIRTVGRHGIDLGPLDPKTHHQWQATLGRRINVHLNGVDVTRRCFFSDNRKGVVGLFVHDASGRPFVVRTREHLRYGALGDPAEEWLHGEVAYVAGDKL